MVKSIRANLMDVLMLQTPSYTATSSVTDEQCAILHLIQAFEALSQQTNALERLLVEAEKLRLINAFETIIRQNIQLYHPPLPHEEQYISEAFKQCCRDVLYYFLLFVGLIQNAATVYIFWFDLFSLIPAISNPIVIFLSIFNTVLSSFLFYSFEVTFLHEALGITGSNTALSQLLELYSQQLQSTCAINQLLSSIHMLPVNHAQYDHYLQFITLINQDLRLKYVAMGNYPESILKHILKVVALVFGALSSITGSYVAVNALLTTLAASWVGAPLGWGLIITAIVVDLGFYYAMGATSTARLINPDFDNYQELKKELGLFQVAHGDDLYAIRTIKNRFFERKPMQDASTQTEETVSRGLILYPVIH